MKWASILGCIAFSGFQGSALDANATTRTYSYAVTHHLYGAIGTYDRTIDTVEGVTHAESRLRVVVKILGIVVHRESANQTEVWRGKRLMSFQSFTTINGQRLDVRGEAQGSHFMVTSPSGTTAAPADVAASDPWSLVRMGPGVVVSIKTGKIDPVEVTGGEADTVTLHGASTSAHHFHVSTATQPDKWEVWINQQDVPIKFRSFEHSGPVDFTLVSPPRSDAVSNSLVLK